MSDTINKEDGLNEGSDELDQDYGGSQQSESLADKAKDKAMQKGVTTVLDTLAPEASLITHSKIGQETIGKVLNNETLNKVLNNKAVQAVQTVSFLVSTAWLWVPVLLIGIFAFIVYHQLGDTTRQAIGTTCDIVGKDNCIKTIVQQGGQTLKNSTN